jgi:hypothetical protein
VGGAATHLIQEPWRPLKGANSRVAPQAASR